ncbi:hypothetical protein HZY83_07575 [Gemella sp. GH3]|nr:MULTISPECIES: hypothetical protein [unclassified Gemella]MBF0714534.1 hypothetical protein [Gemella sp. GH3.1]NYS51486.1 hypothetical protein [Gemella sp. GH3]
MNKLLKICILVLVTKKAIGFIKKQKSIAKSEIKQTSDMISMSVSNL